MKFFLYIIILLLFLSSCSEGYVPKPLGYYRIDLPEKTYIKYDTICPFIFYYPEYAIIKHRPFDENENCWFDIDFPTLKASIHISYKSGKDDIIKYIEDSRSLVYKHTIKADAINEKIYEDVEKQVYGTLYQIKGNAASLMQFYLTDSVNNFFRGALYFNVVPNKDSLAPVMDFIEIDIVQLIESFEWKK